MSEDTYKTIATPSEGIYTEKRSKFIAIALPVRTVEEVKAHLETYQKKYYDARHVCYAYMLGHERKDFRANDNGEPSGTAGKPILGQINSNELTDILIVVVRYFGGIPGSQLFQYFISSFPLSIMNSLYLDSILS